MIMRRGRVVWGTEKKPRHSTGASAREEKQSGRHVDSTHQQAPSKQVVPLLINQTLEVDTGREIDVSLGVPLGGWKQHSLNPVAPNRRSSKMRYLWA